MFQYRVTLEIISTLFLFHSSTHLFILILLLSPPPCSPSLFPLTGIPIELFQILKDDAVKVLHSIHQQIWKTQQWPQHWKTSVFIPIPKKGNPKEYSN